MRKLFKGGVPQGPPPRIISNERLPYFGMIAQHSSKADAECPDLNMSGTWRRGKGLDRIMQEYGNMMDGLLEMNLTFRTDEATGKTLWDGTVNVTGAAMNPEDVGREVLALSGYESREAIEAALTSGVTEKLWTHKKGKE